MKIRHCFTLIIILFLAGCQDQVGPTAPTLALAAIPLAAVPAPTSPPPASLMPAPTQTATAVAPAQTPTVTAVASPTPPPADFFLIEEGIVLDIIDGDTIDVGIKGQVVRIRYLGINTPERNMPSYLIAKDLNRSLVAHKTVRLERDIEDKDQYGRSLRHVFVDDIHANAEILRSGWARFFEIAPNAKYHAELLAAEREASEAKRGLWAFPPTTTPRS